MELDLSANYMIGDLTQDVLPVLSALPSLSRLYLSVNLLEGTLPCAMLTQV